MECHMHWSVGLDGASKDDAAGSVGARVWESKDGSVSVGAGVSMTQTI